MDISVDATFAEEERRRRRRRKKSSAARAMTPRATPTPIPAAAPVDRLEDVEEDAGTAVDEEEAEEVWEAPVEVGVVVAAAPVVDEDDVLLLDVLVLVLVEVLLLVDDVLVALQVEATPAVETIKKLTLLK